MTSTLAQRVLIERRTLNWNQDQLAAKAGVSRSYVSHIERSQIPNPTIDVVEALAAALGVSPAYLLGWSDIPLPGEANAIGEERVPYTVDPRIQELIDLFEDLDAPTQQIALDIIRTIRRSQHARVVGA
jgi:transcriptional regulator with XRE-family HTH domain